MAKNLNVLTEIRENVNSFVGQEVMIKANRGRRKSLEKEGVLEKTHPNVFVVKVDDNAQIRRLSYSYADLLTDNVELKLKDANTKIGIV
ncbi:protein veg [Iocasia frigidifontis]|uniref:Protein veg n=1 Tax=Iocasia fonsfrigidae TaxID=2682810 RepID=A0A8A7KIS2_9FIRM|nr:MULTISPECIES: Veg family protein [Halanaerobiaceae]AZO93237.1 protein veg [Halocella sp. SP3-1]MTI61421.1 protein veg [Bacillota bacterium]QTL99489.1 protein veg [Iocasia fonsfrigidae]